jgi:hypothetical protein
MALVKAFIIEGKNAEKVAQALYRADAYHMYYTEDEPEGSKLALAFINAHGDDYNFEQLQQAVVDNKGETVTIDYSPVGIGNFARDILKRKFAFIKT